MVFGQIGNLVGRRYERRSGLDWGFFRNPLFVVGVLVELVFVYSVLYVRPVNEALGTGPVSPGIVALAAFGGPLLFGLDWARKRLVRVPEAGSPVARNTRPAG